MRTMFEVEVIRKKHINQGWSIRKIARCLGISRTTVRKALKSAEAPGYALTQPRPAPVMDAVADVVMAWIKADEDAPPKQRHTARRIYVRLVEEYGFCGAESTIRRFVAAHKLREQKIFIPLSCDYGEIAEIDWGQAHVRIAGEPTVAHLFCLKLKKSNVSFAIAFPTEKLEAFLAGHVAAFDWLDGVPLSTVYDNPKTAVTKILAGPERELHKKFSSLRAHYLFDSIFCHPGKGNEKGSVENLVDFVRRNALVPVPDFASFARLNEHLLAWSNQSRERNLNEFNQEKAHLKELPPAPFKAAVTEACVVSKLSLVTFDRNRYSVPPKLRGRTLRCEAFWDRLEFFLKDELVCSHERRYKRGETVMEIHHYLGAIERKPRAVCHAAVVRQLSRDFQLARKRLIASRPDGYRDFAEILLLLNEFSLKEVETGLKEALELGALTATVVRQVILNGRIVPQAAADVPSALAAFKVNLPDLAIYDALITP